jgi:hypothetical protein
LTACVNCGRERPDTATWIFVRSRWGPIPVCWIRWNLQQAYGGWLEAIVQKHEEWARNPHLLHPKAGYANEA